MTFESGAASAPNADMPPSHAGPVPEIPEMLIFSLSACLLSLQRGLSVFLSPSTFPASGVLPHRLHKFPTENEKRRREKVRRRESIILSPDTGPQVSHVLHMHYIRCHPDNNNPAWKVHIIILQLQRGAWA